MKRSLTNANGLGGWLSENQSCILLTGSNMSQPMPWRGAYRERDQTHDGLPGRFPVYRVDSRRSPKPHKNNTHPLPHVS